MPLHHEVAGDGPAVLLVHAGVADSRMWDPQWPALTERRRVVRCDLRGFGRSPLPEDGSWRDADDLAEVLDAAGVERADVVAVSSGATAALELASLHPERVGRLILVSANAPGVEPTQDVEQFGTDEEALLEAGDLDGAVELNVRTWLGPDAGDAARALLRDMQRRAFEIQLADPDAEPDEVEVDVAAIPAETVVITGDLDLELFQRAGGHLEATMPNARRMRLPWAGHLPSLERPDEFTKLLVALLER